MNKDNLNWRLPTNDELNHMYENLHLKGVGGFDNEYYWSSSEVNLWCQAFYFGSQYDYIMPLIERVRVVRTYKSKEDFEIGQETETGFIFDIQGDTIFECKKQDEPEKMNWYEAMEEFGGKNENIF